MTFLQLNAGYRCGNCGKGVSMKFKPFAQHGFRDFCPKCKKKTEWIWEEFGLPPKTYEIWGVDVETYQFTKESLITLPNGKVVPHIYHVGHKDRRDGKFAFGVIWKGYKPDGSDDIEYFDSAEDMANFIYKPHPNVIMSFMNAGYDINSLHPYFRLSDDHKKVHGGKFIGWLLENEGGRKNLDDKVKKKDKKGKDKNKNSNEDRYAQMRDIGNFIQNKTLKDIATDYGIEYIDIHHTDNPRIKEACISHARAAALIMRNLQDIYNLMGGELGWTGSASSRELFRRGMTKPNDVYESTRYLHWENQIFTIDHLMSINNLSGMAYYGGRTEIFKRGYFPNTRMIDIVSSYPNEMQSKVFPDMNTAKILFPRDYVKNNEIIPREWMCDDYVFGRGEYDDDTGFPSILQNKEGCAFVKIKVPKLHIPILPIKLSGGKLDFLSDTIIEGAWTFPELRYALKNGHTILKVGWVIYADATKEPLFTTFIDDQMGYKKQKATKGVAKLNMNGLSGKFGQKVEDDAIYTEIELADGETIPDDSDIWCVDEVYYQLRHKDKDGNELKKNKDKNPFREIIYKDHSYPLIVAYITSYARIHLRTQMEILGFENVLYCDTDSIVYIDNGQYISEFGSELGNWETKWEGEFEARSLKYYRFKPKGNRKIDKWEFKKPSSPIKVVGDGVDKAPIPKNSPMYKQYWYPSYPNAKIDNEWLQKEWLDYYITMPKLEENYDEWNYVIKGVRAHNMAFYWQYHGHWDKYPVKFATALRQHKDLNSWLTIYDIERKYQDKRRFFDNGESEAYKLSPVCFSDRVNSVTVNDLVYVKYPKNKDNDF